MTGLAGSIHVHETFGACAFRIDYDSRSGHYGRMKKRNTTDAKTVIGYIRVSTDEQALGPEAQRAALEKWCAANGAELVAVLEDIAVSGGADLDHRPGLLAAIDALEDHAAGVLLVAKRDRLARDTMIAAMVERLAERKGARVLAADGTGNGDGPEAMLMRGMIDLFAQYERALIRARTKAALAVKRSRGERTGGVPYGSRLAADGRTLEAEPTEQATIVRMRGLRAEGCSIRTIADRLNTDGVQARGARWHATTVARALAKAA
jgi:DNA invertase Pin-like site-specific DNA recombinase